jgi:natural product precursor
MEARAAVYYSAAEREASMKKQKKLTLSKETLRTLDKRELSLVAGGGNASGAHNPAQCPGSHHQNCG